MSDPDFAKPDRYKLDSYYTYNFRRRDTYDSCVWLAAFGIDRWDRAVIREIGSQIASLDVLDVGCATGRLLMALAEAGAKRLCGTDLAPRILEVAGRKLTSFGMEAELRAGDAEHRIPWPDCSFDVVTLTGVLHHFMRPHDALDEIARVLRNDGRLILVDPWFLPPVRQLFNLYLRVRPAAGDCRYYSPGAVSTLLQGLGWRQFRSERVGWSGFMVCAVRSE